MKKFIATLLSALVGAFGFTLVDSTIEDRITALETEVVELREELSEKDEISEALKIGDYIEVNSTSLEKFLLRENKDGILEFIHPSNIDQVLSDDIFVYLTDVTCRVTSFEDITFELPKGKNYEPISVNLMSPLITIRFKGHTSQDLAEKSISFATGAGTNSNYWENYKPDVPFSLKSTSSNIIQSNGNFEFEAVYALNVEEVISSELNYLYFGYGSSYFSNLFPQVIKEQFDDYGIAVYNINFK